MSNGLKGLIEKYAENADNGSFESLMCQFALDMINSIIITGVCIGILKTFGKL